MSQTHYICKRKIHVYFNIITEFTFTLFLSTNITVDMLLLLHQVSLENIECYLVFLFVLHITYFYY